VITLDEPVVIIGDIHGQYFDMIHMFEKVIDSRPGCKTLFLGDYVDRGIYSVEVMIFLLSLKMAQPNETCLLRGNHETQAMTEHFTFRDDILNKYEDENLYDQFLECFKSMPVCATVNKEYICMHGGISPEMGKVEDINELDRF
jgi:serine/threonine-protein phosphatase 2B catalytic subunit